MHIFEGREWREYLSKIFEEVAQSYTKVITNCRKRTDSYIAFFGFYSTNMYISINKKAILRYAVFFSQLLYSTCNFRNEDSIFSLLAH